MSNHETESTPGFRSNRLHAALIVKAPSSFLIANQHVGRGSETNVTFSDRHDDRDRNLGVSTARSRSV